MVKYVKKESPLKGLTKKEPRTINMKGRPKLEGKSNKSVAKKKAGPKKMGKAEVLNRATKAIGADKAKIKARGIGGPAAVGTLLVAGAAKLAEMSSDENLYPKGIQKTESLPLPKQKKQPARSQPKGTSGNMAGKVVSNTPAKKKAPASKPSPSIKKKSPAKPTGVKGTATSNYKPMNSNTKSRKYSSLPQSNPPKIKGQKKSKLPKSAQFIQNADW